MSEVREQAAHAAIVGLQRRQILEWFRSLRFGVIFRGLRLHPQFLRMPLKVFVTQTSVGGGSPCKAQPPQTEVCVT